MTDSYWLRNIRPLGNAAEDFLIRDGRIAERRPASGAGIQPGEIDGAGQLLVPPLVESHCHLDKTL